jgi:hypothetical protein
MNRKTFALLPALLVTVLGGAAEAQIGSGWTEFTPEKTVQLRGAGARYTNENGIETFSTEPGDERAEARIVDDHRSGTWQFEGWVNVKAGVNGGCVHQVFKFLMIVAYPDGGGELRQHSYQRLNATGVYDKWVRVNTIHDADAGRADVYIDGTWRGMVRSNSPGPEGWYHKYGIYNSSGTRPVVKWRDVKFWKGGKGDTSAQPADGGFGTVDARSDGQLADARPDAGDGGQGGMTGAGGGFGTGAGGGSGGGAVGGGGGAGSGTGGATGAGGTSPPPVGGGAGGRTSTPPRAGGSPGAAPGAPADDGSGCGCRLAGAEPGTGGPRGAAALFMLALLGMAMRGAARRRRRR